MSNSEPSAIVLQGIPCMYGLYMSRFEWRKRFAQGSPRFTLSRSRMRSRTGLASPVENQACGIAKYPRLRAHRHEARMTPAKRRSIYPHCRVLMSFNGMTAHFGKNPYERKNRQLRKRGKSSASNRSGTRWPLGRLF